MCSILAILDIHSHGAALRKRALQLSKLQRHRGPDWSGIYTSPHAILAHERLSIVDVEHGAQPLVDPAPARSSSRSTARSTTTASCERGLKTAYAFQTASDCEVILSLYDEQGPDFLNDLNGIFAFVLYDPERDRFLIARDHIGDQPALLGPGRGRQPLRRLGDEGAGGQSARRSRSSRRGHYLYGPDGEPTRWYRARLGELRRGRRQHRRTSAGLRAALEAAVKRQLMCDVPYGVLHLRRPRLLDHRRHRREARGAARRDRRPDRAWWPRIHSFSIGLEGAPDLAAAREVADAHRHRAPRDPLHRPGRPRRAVATSSTTSRPST